MLLKNLKPDCFLTLINRVDTFLSGWSLGKRKFSTDVLLNSKEKSPLWDDKPRIPKFQTFPMLITELDSKNKRG